MYDDVVELEQKEVDDRVNIVMQLLKDHEDDPITYVFHNKKTLEMTIGDAFAVSSGFRPFDGDYVRIVIKDLDCWDKEGLDTLIDEIKIAIETKTWDESI